MVTTLVSPPVNDAVKEPAIDAARPRRAPKPSKKKLDELENAQQCEEPKRKNARKEPGIEKGQNHKEPKPKQIEKEPEASQRKKSANKRKAADPKDAQDVQLISAANTQRVQNLLQRRQHASCRSEVVEIEDVTEENRNNSAVQYNSSVQPKSKRQLPDVSSHSPTHPQYKSPSPEERRTNSAVQYNSSVQPNSKRQLPDVSSHSPTHPQYKSPSPEERRTNSAVQYNSSVQPNSKCQLPDVSSHSPTHPQYKSPSPEERRTNSAVQYNSSVQPNSKCQLPDVSSHSPTHPQYKSPSPEERRTNSAVQYNSSVQPKSKRQLPDVSTHSPTHPRYKSPSPVRFQFSSPSVGSNHSASRTPSPNNFSMSSPQPLMDFHEVLSPSREFSISQSLSHCSDYDVSDLEGSMDYSRNTSLHQLQTAKSRVSRDDTWQGMASFPDINNPCPSCQPLLLSLGNRLSILEAEVEKLRRKQRKVHVWRFFLLSLSLFY